MNHLEKTFQEMQKSCISVWKEYESTFNQYDAIKIDFNSLIKNEQELDEAAKIQQLSDTEGHVSQKKADINQLAKLVYKLSRGLCHYAKVNNNQVLLGKVDYSESKLIKGEENEVMRRFKIIIEAGRENLRVLGPYNVTAATLDALEAQYKKLASLPETINQVTANRKTANRSIKELNAEARVILDRLDDAIEAIIDDEKIIDAWFEARKIKGRRSSSKDEENGDEIMGENKIMEK